MKIVNCGIVALEKISPVKKISAHSLIQMAGENGLRLFIYQVKDIAKDLMLVPRPAIFHAKDHFVYVKNGEPLPEHDYTGFVISQKVFKGSRIVSYAEAKQITGSKKKGKGNKIGGTILKVVGTVVGAVVGGPPGAAIGATLAGGGEMISTRGHPTPVGLTSSIVGGASGTGILGKAMSPLVTAAAGAAPGIEQGDYKKAAIGAVGGYVGAKAARSFAEGYNQAPAFTAEGQPSSFLQKAGYGFRGTFGIPQPTSNVTPSSIPTPVGYGGTVTIPGQKTSSLYQIASLPSQSAPSTVGGLKITPATAQGVSALSNIVGGANVLQNATQAAQGVLDIPGAEEAVAYGASQLNKPDTSMLDRSLESRTDELKALKTYVGDTQLPQMTARELERYINTPLESLTSEMAVGNDPVVRQINQSYDRQIENTTRQYAQAGQSFTTSSDLRQTIQRINDDRAVTLREASVELRNINLSRAIEAKQFALARGFEQNRYDSVLAEELAKQIGADRDLKLAIQTDDYNKFQEIIMNILNIRASERQHQQDLKFYANQYGDGAAQMAMA